MGPDELQALWAKTLPDKDWSGLDPHTTYRPADGGAPDATLPLPPPGDVDATLPPPGGLDATLPLPADAPTVADTPPLPPAAVDPLAQTLPVPIGSRAGPPPLPGTYEELQKIGEGGMGVVFRARQRTLARDVAIKKILDSDASGQERFVAEAIATARLDHPNVVPIHDLGRGPTGEVYLAMKLVEGTSWKALLRPATDAERERAANLELTDHLRILVSVCNAVAYAHSREIVHNDLKPENVMIGEFGEVLVMDWGLAVGFDERGDEAKPIPHRSTILHPCGTPSYMPPELAEGRGDDVGPWTDVYLLGSILYEVATGRPPHAGKSLLEVLVAAVKSKPPEFPPDTPAELAEICRKALAANPADRHPSAVAFRDAVEAFLAHRESTAISDAATERLRGCQAADVAADDETARNTLYAGFAAAVAGFEQALLLWDANPGARAGVLEARLAYARGALRHRDLGLAEAQLAAAGSAPEVDALASEVRAARLADARAERAARRVRWGLAAALATIVVGLTVGFALVNRARQRAERAREVAEQERARAEDERQRADTQRTLAEHRLARGLVDQGDSLAGGGRWREARARYVEAGDLLTRLGSRRRDAELGVWEAHWRAAPPLVEVGSVGLRARAVALDFDERGVYVGSDDGAVRLWSLPDGALRATHPAHDGPVLAMDTTFDADLIATAGADGVVKLWQASPWQELARFEGHTGPVPGLAFSWGGSQLVSAGQDGALRLWDVAERKLVEVMDDHADEGPLLRVGFSFRGYMFAARSNGVVGYWDEHRRIRYFPLRGHTDAATCVVHAPNQKLVVSGSRDRTLRVWTDYERGPRPVHADVRVLRGHAAGVTAVTFSTDGRHLISGARDGVLKVWETQGWTEVGALCTYGGAVEQLDTSSQGTWLAAATSDGRVGLWDLGHAMIAPTGAERPRDALVLSAPDAPAATAAALTANGRWAAAGRTDGRLVVWEATAGLALRELDGHKQAVVGLGFQGDRLVSASAAGEVATWNVATGAAERVIATDVPAAAAAVAEGRVVLAGEDGVARTVDLETGAVTEQAGAPGELTGVAAAPGLLATATASELAVVGDATPRRAWAAGGQVSAVALAPDGHQLAAGLRDGRTQLWDLQAPGAAPTVVSGHADAVVALTYAPDGSWLATGGADGTWRFVDPAEGRQVHVFAGHTDRVRAVAIAGDRVLTAGQDGRVRRWDLDRVGRRRSLGSALDAAAPGGPRQAALGAWLAFHGATRQAADAFAQARLLGHEPPAEDELRAAWELGRTRVAREALAQATEAGALPPTDAAWIDEVVARLFASAGSEIGREPALSRGWSFDLRDGSLIRRTMIYALAFAPDGRRLVASSAGRTLTLWDAPTGRPLRSYAVDGLAVNAVVWPPGADWFLAGDGDGELRAVEAETGDVRWTLPAGRRAVDSLVLAPDASWGLVASGNVFTTFRPQDGTVLGTLQAHDYDVECLAISPDGAQVASGSRRGEVKLWSASDWTQTGTLEVSKRRSGVQSLAFSADGRQLVVSTSGNELSVWSVGDGSLVRELTDFEGTVYRLLRLPDGRIATAASRGDVRIWDLATGQVEQVFPRRLGYGTLAVTPAGDRLVVGEGSGRLAFYALDGGE